MELINKRRLSLLFVSLSYIASSNIARTTALSDSSTCTGIRGYDVIKVDSNDASVKLAIGCKKIHFVRHAQGFHNVAGETDPIFGYLREDLEDAMLTELGKQQCEQLSSSLDTKFFKDIKLILVSPMRRTIQTALYSFPNHAKDKKIIFLANELIREQTGMHPCDRRRTITQQKLDYPRIDYSVIVSDVDPIYKLYTFREPEKICAERGKKFMEYLFSLDEKDIIVVTHSAWLRHLFKHVLKAKDFTDDGRFANGQMKSFIISEKK